MWSGYGRDGMTWEGEFYVTKKVKAHEIQIIDGAGASKVLTSDSDGNGTWQTPSSSGIPTGMCLPFSDPTVPSGYLKCDGSAVSRTTYAALNALYAASGYLHGPGNGTTTFNVPDFRDRAIVGYGNILPTVGYAGGVWGPTINSTPSGLITGSMSITVPISANVTSPTGVENQVTTIDNPGVLNNFGVPNLSHDHNITVTDAVINLSDPDFTSLTLPTYSGIPSDAFPYIAENWCVKT